MADVVNKKVRRNRRKAGIRKRVLGTPERPRLTVYRSLCHMYVQVVDDLKGHTIASAFRAGRSHVGALDLWLGKLADYLELMEGGRISRCDSEEERPLSAWVRELLMARDVRDIVLMADLLEYEILPRLV